MIGLRIGAAELAEIEAGAPAVVLAGGMQLPYAPPLLPLVLKEGVLARPGAAVLGSLPLPAEARLLAVVGPRAAAEALLPSLPAGLAVLPDAAAVLGVLAARLRDVAVARDAAVGEATRLRRALAGREPPRPRLVLDLPPGGESAPPTLTQPLGRPAEGLCTVELHVARGSTVGLKVALLADGRVLGCWRVPAGALVPGWLALDLPEPVAPGPAEAVLEIQAEPGRGEPAALSGTAGGSLALRAWTAAEGWSVLPHHFDWAAMGDLRPVVPLHLPASVLAGTEVEAARAELVGVGDETPRLVLRLEPGATARLRLPPVAVGPADLLRLRLALRSNPSAPLEARFTVETGPATGESVATPPRRTDGAGMLDAAVPLPPGPMARVSMTLSHGGAEAALVELHSLALAAGALGERRQAPPASAPVSVAGGGAPRIASIGASPVMGLGGGARAGEAIAWRASLPAPRLAAAAPGGGAAPVPTAHAGSGGTGFQSFKVSQHLVNGDGSYRHLDMTMAGLVSGGVLWRQLRLKLFDRRGTIGLEFRQMAGWPPMFNAWPGVGTDTYGPFWRLESDAPAAALGALSNAHDRAMLAAVLEVLPELAAKAAEASGLDAEQQAAWAVRGRSLASAVGKARDG